MKYIEIGKKIYNTEKPREARRLIIFTGRCLLNHKRMKKLWYFFQRDPLMKKLAEEYAFVYEQPTRAFFYNQSTFDERAKLVEDHMTYLARHLREDVFLSLYANKGQVLWESEHEGVPLQLRLSYHPGQRKEGLLSVVLTLEDEALYQMMFWIATDKVGNWSMWIGAMQGPNMENAKDVIKKITKQCHAYRTKNLILHATQETAKALGIQKIYAVTNYGYYANNHIRRDRKLKTSFSDFWEESGGTPCADKRFYELPMTEYRKTMEEIPTRKRANYRKRFALLDEIDESIAGHIRTLLRQ